MTKPEVKKDLSLKVKALKTGYYGHAVVAPDEEFTIHSEEHFSHEWMEPLNFEAPPKKKKAGVPHKSEVKAEVVELPKVEQDEVPHEEDAKVVKEKDAKKSKDDEKKPKH